MGILTELRTKLCPADGYTVDTNLIKALGGVVKRNLAETAPLDWKDTTYWPELDWNPSDVSQYFAVGNSVNFRYWELDAESKLLYCEGKKGGIQTRGARYMWRSLKVCTERNLFPILDASKLSRITLKEVRKIFADDDGQDRMPDLEGRVTNLRNLGEKLIEEWDGRFWNLVEDSHGSLDRFADFSAELRAFDDPLCKLTMVNAIMHTGRGLVRFEGEILPGIDYQLVKQTVRQGVVVPPPKVRDKLRRYALLTRSEAAALRSTALYALLEIARIANVRGDVLDNLYWSNGRRCDDSAPVCTVRGRERECPFLDECMKLVDFRIPLETTRYY